MDKKLLEALNNLSFALEEVSEALKDAKESKKDQAATTTAMSSGDIGVQLKEISADLKQLKNDTRELLSKQKTIVDMQKTKSSDKSVFEKVGSDKKSENAIKKGLGTILLIAVAVLAIGLAFKLVGKVDFLSVIGLGIAIVIISKAFKEVAGLRLTLKEAAIASLAMVMMAAAVTASSWILSVMKPITIPKLMTGIAITAMFAVMAPKVAMMVKAISPVASTSIPGSGGLLNAKVGGAGFGTIGKVFLMLLGLSAVITASSWILRGMAILTPFQMVTGVAITSMFYVAGPKFAEMAKKATGIMGFGGISWMAILKVKLMLVGMALAIVASSHILRGVHILTPFQMITSIAITAMFWMMGNFLPKIAMTVIAVSKLMTRKDLAFLPILMVAMSTAVMLSSHILALSSPLTFMQMITTALITGLFWLMAQFLPQVALSVYLVEKKLGKNKIFFIPLVFLAMAVAIAGAGLLFSKTPPMSWKQMVSVLVIGLIFAGLSYVMPEMAIGIYIMEKKIGKNKVWLIPLIFVAMATAIFASAVILEKMPTIGFLQSLRILAFSVVMAVSMFVIGFVSIFLTKKLGVVKAIKAGVIIVVLATAIWLASKILKKGDYSKWPSWKWSLNTALALGVFAGLMILIAKMKLKTSDIVKGGFAALVIAALIFATDKLLSMGKYEKYPGYKWSLNVGLAILTIGAAMIGLGFLMMFDGGASLLLGTIGLAVVAFNIVNFAKQISKGKYDETKVPSKRWLTSVALSIALFGAATIGLGFLMLTGVGGVALLAGGLALFGLSKLIVKVADVLGKGKYEGGPPQSWSRSVGSALRTFTQVVMDTGWTIVASFGAGGLAIKNGIDATVSIADAIQQSSHVLAKGNYKGGPTESWAKGVYIAMKAFWPIYEMLIDSQAWYAGFLGTGGITPDKFTESIKTVVGGIVTAAELLVGQPDIWKSGPSEEWARGVSISLKAFWPIYEMLVDSQAWYSGFTGQKGVDPAKFTSAIRTVVDGIVAAADRFAERRGVNWKFGPSEQWARGVGKAVSAFAPVYTALVESNKIWSRPVTAEQLSSAIGLIADAIIVAAGKFADNTAPFAEGNYPKAEWGRNVGAAIRAFIPVFTAISEQSGLFTSGEEVVNNLVYGISSISSAIVSVGMKFSNGVKNGIDWTMYPNRDWSDNIFESVNVYVETALSLKDSGYAVEEDMTLKVTDLLIRFSWKMYNAKQAFTADTTLANKFMTNVKVVLNKYLQIGWMVNKNYTPSMGVNNIRVADNMVAFAKHINRGKAAFAMSIDPTYMARMMPNIIMYMEMTNMISKSRGGLGKMMKDALSGDPVTQMADGMVRLAGSYDKMAKALSRFARSLSLLDEKKLQVFKGVNTEMLKKSGAIRQEGFLSQVSTGAGNLVGAVLNRATNFVQPKPQKRDVEKGKFDGPGGEKKGRHGNQQQQLDKVIEALNDLVTNTKSLESFINDMKNRDEDA